MDNNKRPVYRRIFIPWYDTDSICFTMLFFMIIVFLFAIMGISVAFENMEYREFINIPVVLLLMSGTVIFSIVLRLIGRNFRLKDDTEQ